MIQKNNKSTVISSGLQGSNILSSLTKANCYIRLEENISRVKKGDEVTVLPFDIVI